MTEPVRFKEEDKELLQELMEMESVREAAVDQQIIDDAEEPMTFEEMFLLVIPDDAEPISYPEDEMSWQNAGEAKRRILDLAGENVSVHDVISKYTKQFAREHGLEINNV